MNKVIMMVLLLAPAVAEAVCEHDDRSCTEYGDGPTDPCVDRDVAICQAVIDWHGPRLQNDDAGAYETCMTVLAVGRAHGFVAPVWDRAAVAVAYWESGLTMSAVGGSGEVGPLQVMPNFHCPGGHAAGCDAVDAALSHLGYLRNTYGSESAPMYEVFCRYNGGTTCDDGAMDYASSIRMVMTRIREGVARINVCE